MAKDKGKEKGQ